MKTETNLKPVSIFIIEDFQSKTVHKTKVVPVPQECITNTVNFNYLDEEFELFKDDVVNSVIGQNPDSYADIHINRFDVENSVDLKNNSYHEVMSFLKTSSIAPTISINLFDEVEARLVQNQVGLSIFKDRKLDMNPDIPIKASLENSQSYHQFFDYNLLQGQGFEPIIQNSRGKIAEFPEREVLKKIEASGTGLETLIEENALFLTTITLRTEYNFNRAFETSCIARNYMFALGYSNSPYIAFASPKSANLNLICSNITYFKNEPMLIRSGLDKEKISRVYNMLAEVYPNLLYKANSEQIKNNIDGFIKEQGEKPDDSTKRHNLKK